MKSYTLNLRGQLFTIDQPWIMGILNSTPDSFFAEGRTPSIDESVRRAGKMLEEGAHILDIGGQSTRPGAKRISADDEKKRAIPVIESLVRHFPEAILSIDTFYSSVAREAVQAGAAMVNDVSAGRLDPELIAAVAELHVPYVLMHSQGEPENMQKSPSYKDPVAEVILFLSDHIRRLRHAGIADIIVDPGFGFGKNSDHNFSLLRQLNELNILDCPILAGISRKKMIQRAIGSESANEALAGTIAANTLALSGGASILRVHDVKEAVDTANIFRHWEAHV